MGEELALLLLLLLPGNHGLEQTVRGAPCHDASPEWMERALEDLDTLFSFVLWPQSCPGLLQIEQSSGAIPAPPGAFSRSAQAPPHCPGLSRFASFQPTPAWPETSVTSPELL